MRPFLAALALVALATPARADPPRFEFDLQNVFPGLDRPFTFGLLRAGDWDIEALKGGGYAINGLQFVTASVKLDGIPIASPWLAFYDFGNTNPNNFWTIGSGWQIAVPGLAAGPHRIVVDYAGDAVNKPAPAVWDFSILNIPVATQPISPLPRPLTPRDGVDPNLVPATGFVLLTDADTGSILVKPIGDLLVEDPDTGRRELDLSFLPTDTVVTYPGDANYPAFNFTYNAPDTPVPAPAAPFALALAVLAVARWRRVQRSLPVPSRWALALPAFMLLATPAFAIPTLTIHRPTLNPSSTAPFSFTIERTGEWDEAAIISGPPKRFAGSISVMLNDTLLASHIVGFGHLGSVPFTYSVSSAWGVQVPILPLGPHRITASYSTDLAGSDTTNRPAPAIWDFTVFPGPFSINPPAALPKPFDLPPGVDPITLPTGFVILTDVLTGEIVLQAVDTVFLLDPDTGRRELDLSFLPADTVVTYPGDANYPAFNFTYDAQEPAPVPAPAAPMAIALAALAALRVRRAIVLALLAAVLPFSVQATPAGFTIQPPPAQVRPGQPFLLDILRTGDWDPEDLREQSSGKAGDVTASFDISLDGAFLANQPLAIFTGVWLPLSGEPVYLYPQAWTVPVPGLDLGLHEIVVYFAGIGAGSSPVSATLNLFVGPVLFPLGGGAFPLPVSNGPGATTRPAPKGDVTLLDLVTDDVRIRPIGELLATAPNGALTLDLSWLTGDTYISYPGDTGYPAFSFTAQPTPAPAAPLPLALLALAALRLGRHRLLHSPRDSGAPQCRTPISSTCASTPPIR